MFPINSNGSILEMKHFNSGQGPAGQDQQALPVLRNCGDWEQMTWLHTAQANVPRLSSPCSWAQGLCFQNRGRRTCFVPGRKYKIKELCLHSAKGGGQAECQLLRKSRTASLALSELCSVGREPQGSC